MIRIETRVYGHEIHRFVETGAEVIIGRSQFLEPLKMTDKYKGSPISPADVEITFHLPVVGRSRADLDTFMQCLTDLLRDERAASSLSISIELPQAAIEQVEAGAK